MMGYRESQLKAFSWLSAQALPQVHQRWVYGLNHSEECQPGPPALSEIMHLHPEPGSPQIHEAQICVLVMVSLIPFTLSAAGSFSDSL